MTPFVRQQPLFGRQPAGVTGQRAGGSDHPVAGHDDGNLVFGRRHAYRPRPFGVADGDGDVLVTTGHAVADIQQPGVDLPAERRGVLMQR